MAKCKNCFGTGTVFPGKTMKAKSKVCPVCEGTCQEPKTSAAKEKKQ